MGTSGLFALSLILSSGLVFAQSRTPEQRDWEWQSDHYPKALDLLMPVVKDDAPHVNVVYRQHDSDGDVPEQYFAIRRAPAAGHLTEALEATVVKPGGSTIHWQLLEMHMADREASFESLVARITLQRQQLTSATCPALRRRADALSKVAFSVPAKDIVVIHPLVRRFVVDVGGGSIDASLYEDNHPLVRWGQTTFDDLTRCATNRAKRE